MNKKIVSFVLAMVLTVGLGVGSLYAYVGIGGHAGQNIGKDGTAETVKITVDLEGPEVKNFVKNAKGNLITVYGWAAGNMTHALTKDGISFYEKGRGLVDAYKINEDAGDSNKLDFTHTQHTISGEDFDKIEACPGNDYGEKLKYFLTKVLGIPEEYLQAPITDANGWLLGEKDEKGKRSPVDDPKKAAKEDAAWFNKAAEYLKHGINFSITINMGGSEPTVTLSENGKAQFTLGTFKGGVQIYEEYKYNDDGFLVGILGAQLKQKETAGNDNKIQYEMEYTFTEVDAAGRKTRTYLVEQHDSDGTYADGRKYKKGDPVEEGDSYKQKKYVVQEEYTDKKTGEQAWRDKKDDNGNKVTKAGDIITYTYSANGSLATSTDHRTGNTTHYIGGQVACVLNDKNKLVSENIYHNGILQMTLNYGRDQAVVSVNVCDDYGRQLGTVDARACMANDDTKYVKDKPENYPYKKGKVSYAKALSEIKKVLKNPSLLDNVGTANACPVISVNVYKDYFNVPGYADFLKRAGYTWEHANKTAGYQSVIGVTNIGTGSGDQPLTEEETSEAADKETEDEESRSLAGTYTVNGKKITLKADSKGAIYLTNKKDALALLKKAKLSADLLENRNGKYYINLKNAKNQNKAGQAIFKALGIKTSGNMKFDTVSNGTMGYLLGNKYKVKIKVKTERETVTTTKAASKLTTTFYIQGVAAGQGNYYQGKKDTTTEVREKKNGKTTRTEVGATSGEKIDPAVVGTVDRTVTIKGKKYVVLKNAKVDMVDGKGFKSADGEEIYVCIDSLSKDQQKSLKKGTTFAAAGYIDTSVSGKFAICGVYASKISSDSVHNMVQSFSSTLQGNAEYQTNLAANMINIAKGKAAGSLKDNYNYKELWKFYMGANF